MALYCDPNPPASPADSIATGSGLEKLASAMAELGALGDVASADAPERVDALLLSSASMLRNLSKRAIEFRTQRNLLAKAGAHWFWTWSPASNSIVIESTALTRGPQRKIRIASWSVLIDSDQTEPAALIEKFPISTQDELVTTIGMRSNGEGWRQVEWKGKITRRSADGHALCVVGLISPSDADCRPQQSTVDFAELDRMKLDFLANFSHEIRTPLTAILGAACIASDTTDFDELKDYACVVRDSAQALSSLLDDMLEFAQIEAGRARCTPIEIDLASLILEVGRLYAIEASKKGLRLILRISPWLPSRLYADPVRLRQILTNLLTNAIKFTGSGEVEILARVFHVDELAYVELAVRDTGIGIPKDKQSAIFQMFTQADTTTKRRYGGSGLGLTISKKLAEMMDGSLTVVSEAGRGSTFRTTFPMHTQCQKRYCDDLPRFDGKTIAIVDESDAARAALAEMIESIDGRAIQIPSVVELIAWSERFPSERPVVDLLLIDEGACNHDTESRLPSILGQLCLTSINVVVMRRSAGTLRGDLPTAGAKTMVNPFSLKTFAELAERRAIPRENLAPICLSTELSDSSTNPHEKSSLSILLAEDNATNRRVICRFLERRGHRVVEASNGEEAVERFKENALLFDIILMDIQMPRMDGFEAAQMIRACEERRSWVGLSDWKRTPILALTADAMPSIQQAIADSGMDGVVLKPATPEQLLVAIRKACEKARSAPLHASNLNFINAARETSTSPAESQVDYFADLIDRLDKSLLDLRVPMTWVENDYVEMGRLIALSLRELPDLCLRGDTLIKMRDINGLAGLVHRAKASLNILGANSTVTVCQALLDTCIQGSLEEVSGLWSQLRQNCQQLRLLLLQVESILESVTAQHLRQASPACTTQTTAPESSARLTAST